MKAGQVPTLAEWAKLKEQGWTVESWNAEMDRRRNAPGVTGGTMVAAVVFTAIVTAMTVG